MKFPTAPRDAFWIGVHCGVSISVVVLVMVLCVCNWITTRRENERTETMRQFLQETPATVAWFNDDLVEIPAEEASTDE